MKKILGFLLFAFAGTVFGSDGITLPAQGHTSAESIRKVESQLLGSKRFQRSSDTNGHAYSLISPSADSFIYFFTTPAERAHPAMVKVTIHPMVDPRQPKENDIETFGAYAGKEEDFRAWSYRIGRELGRGFGDAVFKK
ncbi:hypothetical protein LK542_10130 [Massilia sp. IC2-477]|uniref:hypothetical protein n=1 Tax=unclassified Massilia TaxID=2609279 RepID=UPI001D1235FA|nr:MULTISPECIES: hypothetical protein [unclassified Massilia]MCC2955970.1 hypothetical protein [Massilia sp. IC2-477]MCC2970553.1 hypothetical protein [Massilia sp. IC2-476]